MTFTTGFGPATRAQGPTGCADGDAAGLVVADADADGSGVAGPWACAGAAGSDPNQERAARGGGEGGRGQHGDRGQSGGDQQQPPLRRAAPVPTGAG
ncbi:hypothetical protein ACFQZ4_47470 [Catellatospora coxensis]